MTYLEQQIEALGYDKVYSDYMSMRSLDFMKLYKSSSKSAISILGYKKKGKKERSKNTQYLVHQASIRDGIKTDRWEQPKENRYWEKKGFEVKQVSHLKTSLL